MSQQLFRKSSIDRISSPEQLNDYVRVASPGVWLVLAAILILLAGIGVWGVFGRLDTTVHTAGISSGGTFTCYVREDDLSSVKEGMPVTIKGCYSTISRIDQSPMPVTEEMDSYLRHLSGLQEGEWVCAVTVETGLADGIYEAEITTESVAPMSFLFN